MVPRTRLLLAGGLWLAALTWLLFTWSDHYPIDLDVYRLGGLAWLDGRPLYVGFTGPPLDPQLPFTYPPIAAVLFSGLSFVPASLRNPVMVAAGFIAMTAVCVAVAGKVRPCLKWMVGPLAAIGALALDPVWMTYGYGQINLFLLALVVIDVLLVTDKQPAWRADRCRRGDQADARDLRAVLHRQARLAGRVHVDGHLQPAWRWRDS